MAELKWIDPPKEAPKPKAEGEAQEAKPAEIEPAKKV